MSDDIEGSGTLRDAPPLTREDIQDALDVGADPMQVLGEAARSIETLRADRDRLIHAYEKKDMAAVQRILAKVERGDTVARIREEARREAFEEAAEYVESNAMYQTPKGTADVLRALAEGDDQEAEEDA